MKNGFKHDWSIQKTNVNDSIPRWFEAFLNDCRAQRMSPNTIEFYDWKLKLIDKFLHEQGVTRISEITTGLIRLMLIELEEDHNPGGVHQVYRVLRAFLR